jgi:hypothetical protein
METPQGLFLSFELLKNPNINLISKVLLEYFKHIQTTTNPIPFNNFDMNELAKILVIKNEDAQLALLDLDKKRFINWIPGCSVGVL